MLFPFILRQGEKKCKKIFVNDLGAFSIIYVLKQAY